MLGVCQQQPYNREVYFSHLKITKYLHNIYSVDNCDLVGKTKIILPGSQRGWL